MRFKPFPDQNRRHLWLHPAGRPQDGSVAVFSCFVDSSQVRTDVLSLSSKGHTVSACRIDKGHLQRACKSGQSRSKGKSKPVGRMGESEESDQDDEQGLLYQLKTCVSANTPPFAVKLKLDGCLVDMEVDTGASLSLMSETTFSQG